MNIFFFPQWLFTILVSAILLPFLVGPLLSETVSGHYKNKINTSYVNSHLAIIADHLNAHQSGGYTRLLETIKPEFPFSIDVVSSDRLTLTKKENKALKKGHSVHQKKTGTYIKALHDQRYSVVISAVNVFAMDSPAQARREVDGVLKLLQRSLLQHAEDQWLSIIEEKSADFKYPLALKKINDIDLPKEKVLALMNGDAVVQITSHPIKYNSGVDRYFQRVSKSDYVISAGPVSPYIHQQIHHHRIRKNIIAASWLGAILIIWIIPSWRSTLSFTAFLDAIKRKQFSYRNKLYTASYFNQIADTLNSMAATIEQSTIDNKQLTSLLAKEIDQYVAMIDKEINQLSGEHSKEEVIKIDALNRRLDQLNTLVTFVLQYAKINQYILSSLSDKINVETWQRSRLAPLFDDLPFVELQLFDKNGGGPDRYIVINDNSFHFSINGIIEEIRAVHETGTFEVVCTVVENVAGKTIDINVTVTSANDYQAIDSDSLYFFLASSALSYQQISLSKHVSDKGLVNIMLTIPLVDH